MAIAESSYSKEYYEANKGRLKENGRRYVAKPAAKAKRRARYVARRFEMLETNRPRQLLSEIKCRAARRSTEFDLTLEWFAARDLSRCEMTGIPFVFAKRRAHPHTLSVDRIDPARGYTQDNCRLVIWAVNRFKGQDSDDVMIEVARALVRHADKCGNQNG